MMKYCNWYNYFLHVPPEMGKVAHDWGECVKEEWKKDSTLMPQINQLLDGLLNLNSERRISAEDALKSPFFDEVREMIEQKQQPGFFTRNPHLKPKISQ